MITSTKILSASYMGVRCSVTEKTARLWMHKVCEAMESSGNHPLQGSVHMDEFVLGGREKEKIAGARILRKRKL